MNTNPTLEDRLAALERAWRASQKTKTVAAVLDSGVLAETFEAAAQAALPLKPGCRRLAVEQFSDGAQFKAPIASLIRLKGQWLTKLGFPPGQQVELKAVSRGVLEIRLCGTPEPSKEFQITAMRLDHAIEADKARKTGIA